MPQARAQTTTITDVSYPKQSVFDIDSRIADPPLVVQATVTYADARTGFYLAVGLFNLDTGDIESGLGNASPTSCKAQTIYAGCVVMLTSPTGSEHLTFELTQPRPVMNIALIAGLLDNSSREIATSFSDVEIVIRLITALRLQLNLPDQVTAIVDGQVQSPGSVNLKLLVGSHRVSVPKIVQLNSSSRLSFRNWSDGIFQENRTVSLSSDVTLNATYSTQYLLTLVSPEVVIAGSGWYDNGTVAVFSVPATIVPMGWPLGVLGGKWEFQGWFEDQQLQTLSVASSFIVNRPLSIEARWYGNYTTPILVLSPVIVLALAMLELYRRGKRRKGSRRIRQSRKPRKSLSAKHVRSSIIEK